MIVTSKISKIREIKKQYVGNSIGFVPTMGYLHQGHISLVDRAKKENDLCVVSIYVNPMQFNDKSDFTGYPVDLKRDLALLEEAGADLVFIPDSKDIYPESFSSNVEVRGLTDKLEGASRPGHFNGVTTIVNKLFNIVQPTRAYFGQKDAQQLLVVSKMVRDLNINIDIVRCPIIRAGDGLALSSRNSRLTEEQRKEAPVLYQSLELARKLMNSGELDTVIIKEKMRDMIQNNSKAKLDYIAFNSPETLEDVERLKEGETLVSLAANFDNIRLIDNTILNFTPPVKKKLIPSA